MADNFAYKSKNHPLGVDVSKVSKLYGNRRTVVHAFLEDDSIDRDQFLNSQMNIFEFIELQLGYTIPAPLKKKQLLP